MKQTTTLKLQVELAFPVAEKHPTGQAKAVFALRDEAARLGLTVDFDKAHSSGPVRITGERWDGKNEKIKYDDHLFFAWAWCEVPS